MTVIAAAVTKQGVVMAADSQTTAGWQKQYLDRPKLWVSDQYAFGGSGMLRAIQVIRHNVTWPKYRPDEDTDLEKFLVRSVVPAIRAGVKDQGVVKTENGVDILNATLLMATGNQLVEISGDGCVCVDSIKRAAIGSGYAEALGRLGDKGPWMEADVVDAVRRAMVTNNGCGGPISVVDTKTLTVRTVQ
jgi:ATP-dependent protease HslVU (ClpYQ) peptidase subunit